MVDALLFITYLKSTSKSYKTLTLRVNHDIRHLPYE